MKEWTASKTGPLAVQPRLGTFGWIRLPDDADVFSGASPDPTAGQNSPHIEFFFAAISVIAQTDENRTVNPSVTTAAGVNNPGPAHLEGGREGNVSFEMGVINLHPVARENFN